METVLASDEVKVLPYSKGWQKLFITESAKIRDAIYENLVEVHHIGSTAIVGMSAKPIIDILVELKSLDNIFAVQTRLLDLGYSYLHSNVMLGCSFYTTKYDGSMGYHLHIYLAGDLQVKKHLLFKEYMSKEYKLAQEYTQLKQNLSAKHRHDKKSYEEGKLKFIKETDNKARIWAEQNNILSEYNLFRPGPVATQWKFMQIVAALQANVSFCASYFSQYQKDIKFTRLPGLSIHDSNLNNKKLNIIFDTYMQKDAHVDANIDRVIEEFKYKNRAFTWRIAHRDVPNNLEKHLLNKEMEVDTQLSGMYLNLDLIEDISLDVKLTVRRALDKHGIGEYSKIETYGSDDYISWHESLSELPLLENDLVQMFVVYVNEKPVARAKLCFYAGIACIFDMTVLKGMRSKGVGAGLLRFLMLEAKNKGYHILSVITDELYEDFYRKYGFNGCTKLKDFVIKQD